MPKGHSDYHQRRAGKMFLVRAVRDGMVVQKRFGSHFTASVFTQTMRRHGWEVQHKDAPATAGKRQRERLTRDSVGQCQGCPRDAVKGRKRCAECLAAQAEAQRKCRAARKERMANDSQRTG